jgi:hypothetical protein
MPGSRFGVRRRLPDNECVGFPLLPFPPFEKGVKGDFGIDFISRGFPNRPPNLARKRAHLTNYPKFFIFYIYDLLHNSLRRWLSFLPVYVPSAMSDQLKIGGETVSTGTMRFKLHAERPVGS